MVTALRLAWPWAVAFAAICYAVVSFDWAEIVAAMSRVPVGPFVLVQTTLILVIFALAAGRWIAVTGLPLRSDVVRATYAYTAVAVAIGQYTPMQVGEALKIKFAERTGLPIGRSAISLVMERIVDLAVIANLAAIALLQRHIGDRLLVIGLAISPLVVILCLPMIVRRLHRHLVNNGRGHWLSAAIDWLPLERLLILVGLTAGKWMVVVLTWTFAMRSVGCSIGVADAMLVVSAASVIAILSLVPGGIGIQEISIKAVLVWLGFADDVAEVSAIAIRLLTPSMIVLGLIFLPALAYAQRTSRKSRG